METAETRVLGYAVEERRPRRLFVMGVVSVLLAGWWATGAAAGAKNAYRQLATLRGSTRPNTIITGSWTIRMEWPWGWGPVAMTVAGSGSFSVQAPAWHTWAGGALSVAELAALTWLALAGVRALRGSRRGVRAHVGFAFAWMALTAAMGAANVMYWRAWMRGVTGVVFTYKVGAWTGTVSWPAHEVVLVLGQWIYPVCVLLVVWSPAVRGYLSGAGVAGERTGRENNGKLGEGAVEVGGI